MNLETIKRFFKEGKYLLVIVLVGFAVYLLWVYLTGLANPVFGTLPKPEIRSLIISKPAWVLDSLETPALTKAGVYQVIKRGSNAKEAVSLAAKLGFKGQPQFLAGELLQWNGVAAEFSLDLSTGALSYKNSDQRTVFSGTKSIIQSFLIQKALDFTTKLGIDTTSLDTKHPNTQFFRVYPQSNHPDSATINNANLILITFKRIIDGLPIVTESGNEEVSVSLNTEGNVLSFDGSNIEVSQGNATYKLKNRQAVIDAVNEGQAKVVRYTINDNQPIPDPSKVFITQGQVKLFDDGKGKYIEPVFVFNSLLFKNFDSVQAETYLPAVESKYLK